MKRLFSGHGALTWQFFFRMRLLCTFIIIIKLLSFTRYNTERGRKKKREREREREREEEREREREA